MEKYKVLEHDYLDGVRKVYEFENGKRVSVIQNPYSYGGATGLWEMMDLDADDPIGWLSWKEVEKHLFEISLLRK